VARDPFEETRTGWVYRSDAQPALAEPAPAEPVWMVPVPTPLPHVERHTPAPRRQERAWIESGFYVMTLPLTFTIGMMIAPVIWMFGSRPQR
jgi:hypothetical protein